MAIVLKSFGTATGDMTYAGQYLKAFDFEAHGGIGLIDMTPNVEEAMRFPSAKEALEFYSRSPRCKPLREDGRPNRPLTAGNWEFETVQESADA